MNVLLVFSAAVRALAGAGRLAALSLVMAAGLAFAGCHSYHVDATVENQTGAAIQLLEIDYPTASFGTDKLAAGELYRYRFQLRGSGAVRVQYTGGNGRMISAEGPTLSERQEGSLRIVLLPAGKIEFHPQITPAQ